QPRARSRQRPPVLRQMGRCHPPRRRTPASDMAPADERRRLDAHDQDDWQLRRAEPAAGDSQRSILMARIVAEGADRYRRPGIVERLAMRLSKLALSPSIRQPLKRIYLRALTLQTRGRGLPASLPGGESVRVLPEYSYLSWNPDEYRAFRAAVGPGMTAFDVGANVGAYSLLLGQWVGATGSVFAFEPAPAARDGLQRHID